MANHYRVSPKYWLKARKRGWNDAQTTLGLYLLTCEHRNLEGLYRLPKPYIAADLGWPARKVEEALRVICECGFAAYDEAAEMVLIPKALKHQAPSTDNQIKGAIAQLERIPRTSLWNAFRMACASHCPKLANAIDVRWPPDPDGPSHARAGSRAPASSSSSNSKTPPNPPQAGGTKEAARVERAKNGSNRRRDRDALKAAQPDWTAWAAEYLPDLPAEFVWSAVTRIAGGGNHVTPGGVRRAVLAAHPELARRAA